MQSITKLSDSYARVSFMLTVTHKPFILSVIMLNVVMLKVMALLTRHVDEMSD
jgi:hypothetical protein